MNSCLYECTVMHHRLVPKKNKFFYHIYLFFLDLDEIDELSKKSRFMSRNAFNWFNFRDKDHLQFPKEGGINNKTVKENITAFLCSHHIALEGGKIMLLTNLSTLGYVFNPVSFFFCFDKYGKPLCTVVEVCNTFLERKMYVLGKETLNEDKFSLRTEKYFYVSPFTELDTFFDFDIKVPGEKLKIHIDDFKNKEKFLLTSLTGIKRKLSDGNLLYYGLKFPLITMKVIFLIHWQALILYFKKVPYFKKADLPQMQREVYNAKTI